MTFSSDRIADPDAEQFPVPDLLPRGKDAAHRGLETQGFGVGMHVDHDGGCGVFFPGLDAFVGFADGLSDLQLMAAGGRTRAGLLGMW